MNQKYIIIRNGSIIFIYIWIYKFSFLTSEWVIKLYFIIQMANIIINLLFYFFYVNIMKYTSNIYY